MNVPGSSTLHHTCFLVRDVDGAAARLATTLGIGPWHVWTITPEEGTVHGRSVRVALAEHGGSSYELLAPISGDSVYVEHLATKGEGFHHTCHAYASREELRAAKAELLAKGCEMIQDASLGDLGEFCCFAVPETASVLELLYLRQLPPPEKAISA
jgi:catechol 2,3-dioxygenase-like lactoylglutathione lyase family enzyme